MGLLECICGYGVAPTADDRNAKAMQTFNLKVRSRCVETPSTRLGAIARGRGSFLFRV